MGIPWDVLPPTQVTDFGSDRDFKNINLLKTADDKLFFSADSTLWMVDFFISPVSNEDESPTRKKNPLEIYPNPARRGSAIIVISEVDIKRIKVFDVVGRLVKTQINLGAKRFSLNIDPLARGFYHLIAETEEGLVKSNFIIGM